ncbi:hypothetical protein EVAR_15749_1 [Eumeta japonica]|uniref:Uncharacterized protein n=1 Tax=Eumeta variegata TaxID=151549 RepID=A0A4C1Z9M3_EUMVA|nr:hypothetical protein EVAR_15749_1 [Eumeta japonica]
MRNSRSSGISIFSVRAHLRSHNIHGISLQINRIKIDFAFDPRDSRPSDAIKGFREPARRRGAARPLLRTPRAPDGAGRCGDGPVGATSSRSRARSAHTPP